MCCFLILMRLIALNKASMKIILIYVVTSCISVELSNVSEE